MKKETGNKVKLGVFVTAGIAFFIVGIFYIGQKQRLFSRTFTVKFDCHDVNGLQAGNNVRLSGITIGTVESVAIISDTVVRVHLLIDKDVKKFVKKDSRASVGSEGLMGDKIVNIIAGGESSTEVEDDAFIQCEEGNSVEEIMAQFKVVTQNAAVITEDLALITGAMRQGQGTIGKLFMDTSMANNIDQTMVNLKEGTAGFSENMEAAKHNFLLRGYYKKQEKEQEKQQKEAGQKNDGSKKESEKK